MNCTELIVHSSHKLEIHFMKFNYEILYKENYNSTMFLIDQKLYTSRFPSKENHTHQINQSEWESPFHKLTTGHTHKLIVGYSDK